MSTTARERSRGKSESWLWKFFKRSDEEYMATCDLCHKMYSYKSTVTNLKRHLDFSHPTFDYSDNVDQKGDNLKGNSANHDSNGDNLDNTSDNLDQNGVNDEDTEVLDEEALELGEQHLDDSDYNSKEELKEHNSASKLEVQVVYSPRRRRERAYTAAYWNHFKKTAEGLALCLHCNTVKSYRSTTHNLRKHLENAHPDKYKTMTKAPDTTSAGDTDHGQGAQDHQRWRHGNYMSTQHLIDSRDWLCHAVKSYRSTTHNLTKHLNNEQLDVYRTMDKAPDTTSAGDMSLEDVGAMEVEVKRERRSPAPARKRAYTRRPVASPAHVYTDDWLDESAPEVTLPTPSARERERDSLSTETDQVELFSKYVAIVLHKLPSGRACAVQAQLMNVLMQAQMEHEKTLNPEPSVVMEVTEEPRNRHTSS